MTLDAVAKEAFGIVPGKNCRKDFFPAQSNIIMR
jgi:hypothetical protein